MKLLTVTRATLELSNGETLILETDHLAPWTLQASTITFEAGADTEEADMVLVTVAAAACPTELGLKDKPEPACVGDE